METKRHAVSGLLFLVFFVAAFFYSTDLIEDHMVAGDAIGINVIPETAQLPQQATVVTDDVGPAIDQLHRATPQTVRGIYLTGWSAGNARTMERIMRFIDETEINAVVIDIKDATGKLSYQPLDPDLKGIGVGTNRIRDLSSLIDALHARDIYVIGRVAVFQDPFFAALHPEATFTDVITGSVWRDYKGISWLRPDSELVWRYAAQIGKDAFAQGFDEINLDYVRYPSDGNLSAIDPAQTKNKPEMIGTFFEYLDRELRGGGIVLSADIFGLAVSLNDGLGIGQKVEHIAPHVDYLCPMVYPSHYYPGTFGIAVPAADPYAIIYRSLSDGKRKLESIGEPMEKLRPWYQDFDLVGVAYTPQLIRAQITAGEELGVDSWLMWDPKNVYTAGAYLSETTAAVDCNAKTGQGVSC